MHFQQIELHALPRAIVLAAYLLGSGEDSLRLTQVYNHVLRFEPLDHPGDDVPFAVRELLEHHLSFSLAQPLQYHLLGRLRGDPPRLAGMDLLQHYVAHDDVGLDTTRLTERDLDLRVRHFLDDTALQEDVVIA